MSEDKGWPSILDSFLGKNDKRFCHPFSWDEWTGATDGYAIVRVPRIKGIDDPPHFPVEVLILPWEPTQIGEWVDLPKYDPPIRLPCLSCEGSGQVRLCPECAGAGKVQWRTRFNDYSDECKTCHAAGYVGGKGKKCNNCDGEGLTYILDEMAGGFCKDEYDINIFLLEKIKKLPGVKLYTAHTKGMFHFRFAGGEGLLMGLLIGGKGF
jgi:hypothetical protein